MTEGQKRLKDSPLHNTLREYNELNKESRSENEFRLDCEGSPIAETPFEGN